MQLSVIVVRWNGETLRFCVRVNGGQPKCLERRVVERLSTSKLEADFKKQEI
jgi:hypothetical protein